MCMQVKRAHFVAATLAGILGGVLGCDDVHTGDPTDPGGPLLLLRVMVQDSPQSVSAAVANGRTTRAGAIDLLEAVDMDYYRGCSAACYRGIGSE